MKRCGINSTNWKFHGLLPVSGLLGVLFDAHFDSSATIGCHSINYIGASSSPCYLVMHTQKDRQADRVRPQRWLIDTNLWSSVADASLGSDLVKAARRKDIKILAAPSVLYELLRTPNEIVRKRFVDVFLSKLQSSSN